MAAQDTTERKARSASEIDFRELQDIADRAKAGDEIAQLEVIEVSKALNESGFKENIIETYIVFFNKTHETNFETLDQIEKYVDDHEIKADDKIDFEELIKTTVSRPKDYVHTLGKLTDKVFGNAITLKKGQKGKHKVYLDKKKTISLFASVNYDKVLQDLGEKAKVPELTEDDRQVLDGIITNLIAGNQIMTYDMIYRGFSGKVDDGDTYIPNEIYDMIDRALDHFRGILRIDNSPEIDVKGDKVKKLVFDGAILHFDRLRKATINGKEIDGEKVGIIIVYSYPSLYLFAKENGNEIDTRDIKLLDVPKLNNTPENLKLKRYLYNRVIAMRNNYERNVLKDHKKMTLSRRILFSSIFNYIGATFDKSNAGRKQKYDKVQKIYRVLDYWEKKGLIAGYSKTRKSGSKEIVGVEINFIKKLEKPKSEEISAAEDS